MNRQSQIQLTPDEQRAYLAEATTMTLCTVDKNGYPHAVAMSYHGQRRLYLHDLLQEGAKGGQRPPQPQGRGHDRVWRRL